MSRSILTIALVGAALLGAPRAALAQSAKASAEVLFAEGRRLMGEGKLDEACPKFADSQKLDPSSGTLLNLANCYEKQGKNASAWATYQEAASLASSTSRADHLATAQKRAAALLPLLPKVTVTVPHPVEGLEIKRDGIPLARGEWGLGVPVDPGNHAYLAEAAGYKPATVPLTVAPTPEGGQPASLTVTIPELQKLTPSVAPPPPVVVVPPPPPPTPPAPPPGTWRPQRTWALIAGGLGVAGFAVSGGYAAAAKSSYNASLASCPHDPNLCTMAGVTQRDDARQKGDVATAMLAVGSGAAALGIILWVTAPAPAAAAARSALQISPGPGSVTVSGRW